MNSFMKEIGVDCRIAIDGTIDIRRIYLDGRWQTVEQGRQWSDEGGRHVLIMLPDHEAQEVLLQPDTLTFMLQDLGTPARGFA